MKLRGSSAEARAHSVEKNINTSFKCREGRGETPKPAALKPLTRLLPKVENHGVLKPP